jgi:hypothetical protein
MSFKIGQDVVCINAEFSQAAYAMYDNLVEKGVTYTVRDIDIGCTMDAVNKNTKGDNPEFLGHRTQILYLEKVYNKINPRSKKEPGFQAVRFAPLNTNEESEEIKIKQPVKIPDLIDA